MNRPLLVLAVAAALSGLVAAPSFARSSTTAPAYNFDIHVTITDNGVVLDRSVAKRGWLAHFIVVNKSRKPVRFNVGGLTTKLIPPGKQGKVGAFLSDRGQYSYKVDNQVKGYFQVV
jgi:hypothetical protein